MAIITHARLKKIRAKRATMFSIGHEVNNSCLSKLFNRLDGNNELSKIYLYAAMDAGICFDYNNSKRFSDICLMLSPAILAIRAQMVGSALLSGKDILNADLKALLFKGLNTKDTMVLDRYINDLSTLEREVEEPEVPVDEWNKFGDIKKLRLSDDFIGLCENRLRNNVNLMKEHQSPAKKSDAFLRSNFSFCLSSTPEGDLEFLKDKFFRGGYIFTENFSNIMDEEATYSDSEVEAVKKEANNMVSVYSEYLDAIEFINKNKIRNGNSKVPSSQLR